MCVSIKISCVLNAVLFSDIKGKLLNVYLCC